MIIYYMFSRACCIYPLLNSVGCILARSERFQEIPSQFADFVNSDSVLLELPIYVLVLYIYIYIYNRRLKLRSLISQDGDNDIFLMRIMRSHRL